jgi:hypothetical protein
MKGPSWLLPSDLAPILRRGSGHSSDIHTKQLRVDTLLFLQNTLFYYSILYSYAVSTERGLSHNLYVVAQLVVRFPVAWATQVDYRQFFF